jgi:hypothetical protein
MFYAGSREAESFAILSNENRLEISFPGDGGCQVTLKGVYRKSSGGKRELIKGNGASYAEACRSAVETYCIAKQGKNLDFI